MNPKDGKRILALSSFFVQKFRVSTVILFGSSARNEGDKLSDIDLLLILKGTSEGNNLPRAREIFSIIPKSLLPKNKRLQLSVYSTDSFKAMYHRGSLFVAHILKEGVVLYDDDGFYQKLRRKSFQLSKEALRQSLDILAQRLAMSDDLEKFNDYFINCLAEFFSISKNLAFIALASRGQLIFDRKRAFEAFAETYPLYREKIRRLYCLRPFFLRNVKGIDVPIPFEPYGCEKKIVELREDVKELLIEVAQDDN